MLFRSIPVPPLMTNCYLLGDEETKLCCLVDPGGAAAKLIQETRSAGYTLAAILLTHGHYDHTTGVSEILKEFPDIPVYIHEKELLADGCLDRNFFMAKNDNIRLIEDGDTVTVGGLSFQVIITPGHTAGSAVFLIDDKMLAGDTLFAGSCGRCDLPGGSMEDMMASLRRLADIKGDYTVYPGHGPFTTLSHERDYNAYMVQACRQGR